jgi:hypothetical protein
MTHRFNRSQIMREANAIAAGCRAKDFYAGWSHARIMAMALRAAINGIYNKYRWSDADKAELDRLRHAA